MKFLLTILFLMFWGMRLVLFLSSPRWQSSIFCSRILKQRKNVVYIYRMYIEFIKLWKVNLFLNMIPDLFSLSILASLSRSGLPDSRDMLLCRAPLQPHLASSCDNWDQSEASVILYQPIGGQHYPICISQSEASMILYQSIRGQNYHEYII